MGHRKTPADLVDARINGADDKASLGEAAGWGWMSSATMLSNSQAGTHFAKHFGMYYSRHWPKRKWNVDFLKKPAVHAICGIKMKHFGHVFRPGMGCSIRKTNIKTKLKYRVSSYWRNKRVMWHYGAPYGGMQWKHACGKAAMALAATFEMKNSYHNAFSRQTFVQHCVR